MPSGGAAARLTGPSSVKTAGAQDPMVARAGAGMSSCSRSSPRSALPTRHRHRAGLAARALDKTALTLVLKHVLDTRGRTDGDPLAAEGGQVRSLDSLSVVGIVRNAGRNC